MEKNNRHALASIRTEKQTIYLSCTHTTAQIANRNNFLLNDHFQIVFAFACVSGCDTGQCITLLCVYKVFYLMSVLLFHLCFVTYDEHLIH